MSLSNKIIPPLKEITCSCGTCDLSKLYVKDVKEFITKLKRKLCIPEETRCSCCQIIKKDINELAGSKLL